MTWSKMSDNDLKQWFFSDEKRVAAGFLHGVKIFETFHDTAKSDWCDAQGVEHRLSYCGNAPAHHVYWFRDAAAASRFLSRWDGRHAEPGEGVARHTCGCDACADVRGRP